MVLFYLLLAVLNRITAVEEAELIKRIKQRDDRALAKLYDLYAKLLYGFILSIVKKQEEAEDVLQEVFVQIWEKSSLFDTSKGNVYTWLVTLSRNRAIDRTRSKQYRMRDQTITDPAGESIFQSDDHTPFDAVVMQERALRIRKALEALPSEQQEAIKIAYFGGYTQSEIAAKLNIPLGTVKTRIRQGMKKLQSQMMELS